MAKRTLDGWNFELELWMRDLCQACGILIWWSNKRIKRTKSGKCLAPKDETCLKTPPFLANYVTVLFMQISILRKRPLQGASTVPKKLFQVWLRVSATKTQKPSFTTQKLEFHYPQCDPIGIYMNIYIYLFYIKHCTYSTSGDGRKCFQTFRHSSSPSTLSCSTIWPIPILNIVSISRYVTAEPGLSSSSSVHHSRKL